MTYDPKYNGEIADLPPEPIDSPVEEEAEPMPVIPLDCLPEWVANYCRSLTESVQAPSDLAALFSLSVLATTLQGKATVSLRGDDYKEPLCLWTVGAAPPGERKTAIINALREPLVKWEAEKGESLNAQILEDKARREMYTGKIKELQARASKSSENEAETLKEIANLAAFLETEPVKAPRLWTSDTTSEQLQNLLATHGERMAVLADEGGIFQIMQGMYNKGEANIDIFLQAWSGSPARISRGSRDVALENPLLTFGLAIQPKVVEELSKGSSRMRGVGALGRFLYVLPESNIGYRDVRASKPVDQGAKSVYEYNIRRLLDIKPDTPLVLTLTQEAREVYFDFAQFIEDRQGIGSEYEPIQDWTAKIAGQALRIAGLFHIADHWTAKTEISAECMKRAVKVCHVLIRHAQKALVGEHETNAQKNVTDPGAKLLSYFARQDRPLSRRDIQRKGPVRDARQFAKAFNDLRNKGYIQERDGLFVAAN